MVHYSSESSLTEYHLLVRTVKTQWKGRARLKIPSHCEMHGKGSDPFGNLCSNNCNKDNKSDRISQQLIHFLLGSN